MQRYAVSQFDSSTFVVIDQDEHREICICANYEDEMSKYWADAEERAQKIASLLNETKGKDQE
jgi:hypothetical protein